MDLSRVDPDAPLDQAPPAYLARRLVEVAEDVALHAKAWQTLLGTIRHAAELLDQDRAAEAQEVLAAMLAAVGTNHVRH